MMKNKEIISTTEYTGKCVHGTLPQCSCACPVNLDIRGFMARISRGKFNSAYKILARDLVFPGIAVEICKQNCRGTCIEDIDLNEMERMCLAYADRKEPDSYPIVPKGQKIAVVGAGISGLTCTLELAMKGYEVTVFDRGSAIGGKLKEVLDQELLEDELLRRFRYIPFIFCGNTVIGNEESVLDGFDAVYVATGKDGADFGLGRGWNRETMETSRDGWFLGGEMTGAFGLESIMQGRIAAQAAERYLLQLKNMKGNAPVKLQRECLFTVKGGTPRKKASVGEWSPKKAMEEALRCRQCDCTWCFDRCRLMQSLQMYPSKMEEAVYSATHPRPGLMEQQGSRMVYSCTACGSCGSACPQGISLEELFIKAKSMLNGMGKFPPQLHSFYLDDMRDANEKNYLLYMPESGSKMEYMFFPGCQATATGTEHVRESFRYLRRVHPKTCLLMGCCSVPALWAGEDTLFKENLAKLRESWKEAGQPTAVVMCATCMKTFREYLPEVNCISLYEVIEAQGLPEASTKYKGEAVIFDPCSSREFPQMQQAVRSLALKAGAVLSELQYSRENAVCCGTSGHIYPANKQMAIQVSTDAAELSPKTYITYCENCRNVFLAEGKDCIHILDAVFGIKPLEKNMHIDDCRSSRKKLHDELAGIEQTEEGDNMELEISEELYGKMDRLHIGRSDVMETIRHCETTKNKMRDERRDVLIGSYRQGYVTYWAEYRAIGENRYQLVNTYSHRISIETVQV